MRRKMKAEQVSKRANKNSVTDEVVFSGTINYDVLLDAQLADKYGYYPCYIEDRNLFARKITCEREPDESFASDLPRIVIDLPYLTLEKAKKLEMTKKSIRNLFQEEITHERRLSEFPV